MSDRPANAFEHRINVTWGDCDPARIVYTGRLPWFALDAINGWWQDKLGGDGWFQMEIHRNVGTPFVRIEMDIMHPVTPRHDLICYVWPERLGETSITFRVEAEQDRKLCFSTRTVSVFTVADAFKKRVPPEEITNVVTAHLPVQPASAAE